MPRARNKSELLQFGKQEFEKLIALFTTDSSLLTRTIFDNRTGKDILAHIHAWHELFLTWYEDGMSGKKPKIPYPGYTWKTTPDLNELLFQQYKTMSWQEVSAAISKSYKKVMDIIGKHSDEELTTKKKYTWTGSTNLASYLASTTSSHYQWASALLRNK
jgi:hypothetical protein